MLCCAQPCQCILSPPAANPHSRSIAPNRQTLAQRQHWGRFPAALERAGFFTTFMWNRALLRSGATFCQPDLPKVPRICREADFWPKLSSCYSLVHFLVDIEPRTRGNRDPTLPTPGASTRKNTFRAGTCFHPWIHALPSCYTSQLLDDGWLTWWCAWHDGVNAEHDHRQ